MASTNAFVTLVSSDSYLPGALAQVAALRDVHPSPPSPPELPFQTVCLVTPETLDVSTIRRLRHAFDLVVGVEILEQDNPAGLKLLGRPDLTTVLTKLHVFRLTQFSKIIFLDADVLPIRPMSHLFSIPHEFSAAPDVGWPDIFNSGVLVLTPGEDKFQQLNQLVATKPSWDGGDQGLLNEWRGGDWNRLSFTYNTTPTAAYTYAPAYERYGSQIKAIHFIGPNKPWKSIGYRSSNSHRSSTSTQTAYDYDSLVDRWFEVYNRHYNADVPQTPFEIKHYTPAWDSPADPLPSAPPLGLDELKCLAIQGLNASLEDTRPGEGAYRSLPLEGRVDLMRPKKPEQTKTPNKPSQINQGQTDQSPTVYSQVADQSDRLSSQSITVFSTPIARRATLEDDSDEPRWKNLPTPRPEEIPSSPRLRLISLPPTPSVVTPVPSTAPDFYASESEAESLLLAGSGLRRNDASVYESHQRPHHHTHHHHGHVHPAHEAGHPHQQHHQEQKQQRSASPPLVSWNPAVEPPPNVTPTVNAFPSETYFANVWDHTPSRKNDQAQSGPSPPDSGGFFQPPTPPVIPEVLIQQGHYRTVTGESQQVGTTPSPDRSKVKTVFPWESQPRVMPARVFPDSDAPPPSLFLSPSSQSQTSTTTQPSTPETRISQAPSRSMPLSPLYGLPTTLNYANAWDNVPSIQKYASRLVKPPPPPTLAPAFEDDAYRKSRKKSWDERAEVSSRDGDDEDNADDEDDGEPIVPKARQWEDDDSDAEAAKRRSRRGSIVTATLKPKKKEYKSRGVQTVIVETRSMAVQVDPPKLDTGHQKHGSVSSRRHWPPATAATSAAPAMTRSVSVDTTNSISSNMLPIAPALLAPEPIRSHRKSPPMSPKSSAHVLRSPREFVTAPRESPQPSTRPSPKIVPSTITASSKVKPTVRTSGSPTTRFVGHDQRMASLAPLSASPVITSRGPTPVASKPPSGSRFSPSSIARRPSNDSSLGSPLSSIGPLSPADGQAVPGPLPARKGTRVWDPARGVDVFKRGSEEVLARFLKMGGAWEEETR
ncbi:hypothetical protein CPC08DRAFT_65516 [Agrocybe pediades]|nr:hypothetical protein CPC08DRAFT_65516 [Agrocybe pediades]